MEVVGHLVRLNFDSWPSSQDQWRYMYGEDMFPIGFCELVQYSLMPPRKYLDPKTAKKFGVVLEEVEIEETVKPQKTVKLASSPFDNEEKENQESVAEIEELLQ